MTEKEKIKIFISEQGISKAKFYQLTGLGNGFLDSGNSLGVDKLKIIIDAFPQLSLRWLVLDEGEMIIYEKENVYPKPENRVHVEADVSIDQRLIDTIISQQRTIEFLLKQIEELHEKKGTVRLDAPATCAGAD